MTRARQFQAGRHSPSSQGITVGETWPDTWNFTANCPATSCTLTAKGSLVENIGTFTATLKPANGGYQGQAKHVQFSHCGGVNTYETVILQLYPDTGAVSNGRWNTWHGTMTLAFPGLTVGNGSCAGGDWVIALTGNGF